MDKIIIKSIIIEKQKEVSETELVERNITFDCNANYVIVGIRRAGKSYQMFQNIKKKVHSGAAKFEDCLYVNFEDERIASITASELGLLIECYEELYENRKPDIYLDEIQNIKGWEKFARRLADSKYRVMITGSNAKMPSKDIATTLGGRYIIREIFPFSFNEYLEWNSIELGENWAYYKEIQRNIKRYFETYLQFGGFAETFNLTNKREWINSLYQKILLGDIIARNGIRNGNAIRLLSKKLAESVMQPTTQTRLLNIVKSTGNSIGRNTIAEYLTYMEDAYLTFKVLNFTDSMAERSTTCKRYFLDNGLLNNFIIHDGPKLLENIVAIDLIKRYRKAENDNVFYYNKNVEVDFYVPEYNLAVQVAYSISDQTTREREIRALVKLSTVFHIEEAVIVTMDEEYLFEENGLAITAIPAWKWLLRE